MKRILVLMFILMVVGAWWGCTAIDVDELVKKINFLEAERVYEKIVKANHIVDAPKLYRYRDDEINAMTYEEGEGAIYICDGILSKFLHNDDEIAMVLAHELGHWAHRGREVNYQKEYDADKFGAKAMDIAGYNHCRGALILWRFGNEDSMSHPPGTLRWLAVTQGCYGDADK